MAIANKKDSLTRTNGGTFGQKNGGCPLIDLICRVKTPWQRRRGSVALRQKLHRCDILAAIIKPKKKEFRIENNRDQGVLRCRAPCDDFSKKIYHLRDVKFYREVLKATELVSRNSSLALFKNYVKHFVIN